MYGFIWRHLPGPAWLKAIESLILIAGVVYVLMQYVFPWANATWHLSGNATSADRRPSVHSADINESDGGGLLENRCNTGVSSR